MLSAVSLSIVTYWYEVCSVKKEIETIIGLVPIVFLMNGPSYMPAEIQSWDCTNVSEVRPYQHSGDCSPEPALLAWPGAELHLGHEHKQEEGLLNNYTALVLQTLVHKINIIHMSDPIKSTALSIAHKKKKKAHKSFDYL